jgi:peptidyl-prolyl cis-trans isomerase SurA
MARGALSWGFRQQRQGQLTRRLSGRIAAWLVGLLLLGTATAAGADIIEGIAVVVNEEIILYSELGERARPLLAAAKQQNPSLSGETLLEEQRRLYRRVLNQMIDEILVGQEARRLHIRITSAEVDRAIENIARQNGLSRADFSRAVEAQGLSLRQYRRDLKRQLERFKVVQTKFQGRMRVPDQDIKSYYARQVRQARAGDRCRLSHIVVTVDTEAGAARRAQRRRRASAIIARAEAGAPFAALAKRYSEDPDSAAAGGSLGWVDSSELPAKLRDVVLGLGTGEVGGPVRTSEGFRIVKVLEWEASDVRPFDEVRDTIRMRLLEQQMEQQEQRWLADLRRKAYVDVRMR